MDHAELTRIADAWIAYHRAGEQAEECHKDFWAYEQLCSLTAEDPETAWQLILTIFNREPSDMVIANLAAGPMEDMLGTYGDQFIERVEELGKKDRLFRQLIGEIWQSRISDTIWSRLRSIAS